MNKIFIMIIFMITTTYSLSPIPVLKVGNSWQYDYCTYDVPGGTPPDICKTRGTKLITIDSVLIHNDSISVVSTSIDKYPEVNTEDTLTIISKDTSVFTINDTNDYSKPLFLWGSDKYSQQYQIQYKDKKLLLNSYNLYSEIVSRSQIDISYLDSIGTIYYYDYESAAMHQSETTYHLTKFNGIDFDSTLMIKLDSTSINAFEIRKSSYKIPKAGANYFLLNGKKLPFIKNSVPNLKNIHLKLLPDTYLRSKN